jgi:hypothetical protein
MSPPDDSDSTPKQGTPMPPPPPGYPMPPPQGVPPQQAEPVAGPAWSVPQTQQASEAQPSWSTPQPQAEEPTPTYNWGQPPTATLAQPAPQPIAPSPSAMPVPQPKPSLSPATVSSLDALPKDAKKKAGIASVWFIISGIVFFAIGAFLYVDMVNAKAAHRAVEEGTLWSFIGVLSTFGALSIVLSIANWIRVLGSMKADKWDVAVDTAMLLSFPGFIFGLGLSGYLLFSLSKKMRTHPFYMRTLPPPTPVCERCRQPVTWVPTLKKWYCPNCHIYL